MKPGQSIDTISVCAANTPTNGAREKERMLAVKEDTAA
jgi:hypothetical protein